eukprot:5059406-Prymnesium_polylepis.1
MVFENAKDATEDAVLLYIRRDELMRRLALSRESYMAMKLAVKASRNLFAESSNPGCTHSRSNLAAVSDRDCVSKGPARASV